MIGYRQDDGGRSAAGYRGTAGDCVTRAVSIVTGADYRTVYRAAAVLHGKRYGTRTARNGMHKTDSGILYRQFGLIKQKLPAGPRPTFTEAYERYGACLVSTTGHVAALVDGALRDITDIRTYEWADDYGRPVTRERKAMSVWIPATRREEVKQ